MSVPAVKYSPIKGASLCSIFVTVSSGGSMQPLYSSKLQRNDCSADSFNVFILERGLRKMFKSIVILSQLLKEKAPLR